MGTERNRYYCKIGRSRIEIQGAKWFYGDGQVQRATGWNEVGDGTVDDQEIIIDGSKAKPYLVRLVAVLSGQAAGGVGNQQQDDSTRRFTFYCDPSKVEDAILDLPNKSVDPGLGLGSYRIRKVYRPRKVSYQ